jgi:hypothetical protein
LALLSGAAFAADQDLCTDEIGKQEIAQGIPSGLLLALARVESGGSPFAGPLDPWPWTVNLGGKGAYFASKEDAIRALEIGSGADIGCMQVSLRYHPTAFEDLATAFDPASNVAYAAKFLRLLKEKTGSWWLAVGEYHSLTPEHAEVYRGLVQLAWSGAAISKAKLDAVRGYIPADAMVVDLEAIGSPEETALLLRKQREAASSSSRPPRLVIVGGQ